MSENIYGYESAHIEQVLSRRVYVPLKPPPLSYSSDLAVIASVAGNTPADFVAYAKLLTQEFGQGSERIQVLIADNTPRQIHGDDLKNMGDLLAHDRISFQPLESPTPGKVLGLNAGIAQSSAPVCIFVDMNKRPKNGTLRGLYGAVAGGNVDLVSARVAGTLSKRGHPTQWWNDGKAYAINSHYLPTAFPEILADDAFISGYVLGHGGRFAVAPDKLVVDTKGIHSSYEGSLQRTARQWAALVQLNYLTVYDNDGAEIRPSLENMRLPEKVESRPSKIAGTVYSLTHLTSDERIAAGRKLASKATHILSRGDDLDHYKKVYLEELLRNPDMCAW